MPVHCGMRLLTRHIHRAFVELDPYDDAQCGRFIRSARGGLFLKLVMAAVIGIVGLGMTVVGAGLWTWMLNGLVGFVTVDFKRDAWKLALWVIAALPLLGLGPVVGYIVRDRLLQWRLRYVLRTRGRCAACGYSLIGLALSERSTVMCPECGVECMVDMSLGELTRTMAGRVLVDGAFHKPPPTLSVKTRRRLKRAVWVAGLFIFVVIPGTLGTWEFLIRRDAALARADGVRLEGELFDLMRKSGLVPPGTAAGGETARAAIDRAVALAGRVEGKWYDSADPNTRSYALLSPRGIFDGSLASESELSPEDAARALANAKLLLKMFREGGLEEALADVANSTPELPDEFSGQGLNVFAYGFISSFKYDPSYVDDFLGARALECRKAFDVPGLLKLIDIRLGLARVLCASPMMDEKVSGLRSEFDANALIVEVIATHPGVAVLKTIESALDRQAFEPRMRDMAEWHRIQSELMVARHFAEPNMTRLGPFTETSRDSGGFWWMPLGGYMENRDECAARCRVPEGVFEQDAYERTWLPPNRDDRTGLLVARMVLPESGSEFAMADRERMERRGIRLLLAIEKYRAATGKVPEALAELVPGQLAKLPVDPWSGKPFVYRRVDPAQDQLGREFLLYSVGADRVDDGGIESKDGPARDLWLRMVERGIDVIINRPR